MLAGTVGALPRFYGSLGSAARALGGQVTAILVLPGTPEPDYRAWGNAHDALVKQRFRAEMDGSDTSGWIANNDRATAEWPAALGYYVGFRIARGYYERAADRQAALQRLLALRDPHEILRQSGYLD